MKKAYIILACLLIVGCGGGAPGGDPAGEAADESVAEEETNQTEEETNQTEEETVQKGLQFTLDGAVGFVRLSPELGAQSVSKEGRAFQTRYGKLLTDGAIDEFVEFDDSLSISDLMIASDGSVFIVLASPIDDGDGPCILLRVGQDSTFVCIDRDLASVSCENGVNDWIQYDSDGGVYYAGIDGSGKAVLRRWSIESGNEELLNDNIDLDRFLVGGDGTVYLYGRTVSTGSQFLRRFDRNAGLANINLGWEMGELVELGEDVFVSVQQINERGVYRIDGNGFYSDIFIGADNVEGYGVVYDVGDNEQDSCEGDAWDLHYGFCLSQGSWVEQVMRVPSGAVYTIVGYPDMTSVWQYYPDVKPIDTSVYRPTLVRNILDQLLIAGYDQALANRFVLFTPSTAEEIDLLGANDIEVYHFDYAQSGLIYFDGLRFSDNTYVIGTIDTTDGNRLTVLNTSAFPYEDLVLF